MRCLFLLGSGLSFARVGGLVLCSCSCSCSCSCLDVEAEAGRCRRRRTRHMYGVANRVAGRLLCLFVVYSVDRCASALPLQTQSREARREGLGGGRMYTHATKVGLSRSFFDNLINKVWRTFSSLAFAFRLPSHCICIGTLCVAKETDKLNPWESSNAASAAGRRGSCTCSEQK